VLLAAHEFHVLPEDIENRMTKRWWDLWVVYREESYRAK
jgi:hypothetical protein